MPEPIYDLIVIRGDPAGNCGTVTAAAFRKKVAVIEQAGVLGGAGINTGTVPSKTLRESALLLSGWRAQAPFHIGLIALLTGGGAELFSSACFNYPTLGELCKTATYDAIMLRMRAASSASSIGESSSDSA
jgi:hypothetical protein